MGRRYDSLSDLRKRRDSWLQYVGKRGQFGDVAPQIVAQLDMEIRMREQQGEA